MFLARGIRCADVCFGGFVFEWGDYKGVFCADSRDSVLYIIMDLLGSIIAFGCCLVRGLDAWKTMETLNNLGAYLFVRFAIVIWKHFVMAGLAYCDSVVGIFVSLSCSGIFVCLSLCRQHEG